MKKMILAALCGIAATAALATSSFASSTSPINTDWEAVNPTSGRVETFLENALSDAEIKDDNGLVSYRTVNPSTPHASVDYVDLFFLHEGNRTTDNVDGYWESQYDLAHQGYEIVLNLDGQLLVGGIENAYGVYAKCVAEAGMELVSTSKHSADWGSDLCVGANDMVLENSLVVLTEEDWCTPIIGNDGEFEYAIVLGEKWVAPVAPAQPEPKDPATEPEAPATEPEAPATEPEAPATEPEDPTTEPETPEQPEQEPEHVYDYNPQEYTDPDEFVDSAFDNPLEPSAPSYLFDYNHQMIVDADTFIEDETSEFIETYEANGSTESDNFVYEANGSTESDDFVYEANGSTESDDFVYEASAPSYYDYAEQETVDADAFIG